MSEIAPEIIVTITAFAVLILDLFLPESKRQWLAPLAILGTLIATVVLIVAPHHGSLLGGRFIQDAVSSWFKVIFLVTAAVAIVLSMNVLDGAVRVRVSGIGFRGEYYAILLFSTIGAMFLVSATDLATLFVSLEAATLPLVVLAAWRRGDAASGEAGLKYVILSALASASILYGFGILYGLAASTDLATISTFVTANPSHALWLAASLLIAGIGFKLTLVPFHMWAADVYQGAPTPVTAYLSVASKAAGLAFAFQVIYRIFGGWIGEWGPFIAGLALFTMTIGNLVAIVQQNIKRFMAFSAISQAGYFLLGFLGPAPEGVPAMLFYLLVYVLSNLAAFACIIWFANETGLEQIDDYRGLSQRNPVVALAMMLALFSLAGIPPLAGFVGKFFLFSIASQAGYHWLVAAAAVNSTLSLFYYLRVVRQMYIEPKPTLHPPLTVSRSLIVTIALLSLAVSTLGIVPVVYHRIHESTIAWLALALN